MNNIYDNGAVMLGDVSMIIKEIKKEMQENLDMLFIDMDDLLKEMQELQEIDKNMIVCINYENPMGYTYTCWSKKDIINKYRGE